jgi:hypothetical protein
VNAKYFELNGVEVREMQDTQYGHKYILFRTPELDWATSILVTPQLSGKDSYWKSVAEKVKLLVFNRVDFGKERFKTEEEFSAFLNSHIPSESPENKLNKLLAHLHSNTHFDGEAITYSFQQIEVIRKKLYFEKVEELMFYFGTLLQKKYIHYTYNDIGLLNLSITMEGLVKVISINEAKNSTIVFVAMSFDEDLFDVYEKAIKPALESTGFSPLIIRNEHVPSETTINDAIIAGIKKSKFTIADFTGHKRGVYFEAGFALGRGQKVIYTCRKDEMNDAHFDTRNYQHVVWESIDDLREKLIDKIEAYIFD